MFTATVDQWLRAELDRRMDARPSRTTPGIFEPWVRPELYRGYDLGAGGRRRGPGARSHARQLNPRRARGDSRRGRRP